MSMPAYSAMVSRTSVENKASQFDSILGDASESNSAGNAAANTELAEMIRRQRAALDAADATATAKNVAAAAKVGGRNACDNGLRACISEKCGKDFTKCAADGDTDFGIKMDACRTKTECTGEEFRIFSNEIKADRDLNAQMALYNKTLECGNNYNACIIEQCGGTKYTKCLGKSGGDAAIDKCKKIADDCRQSDTGLASRTGEVFAALRQDAEVIVKQDEQRLYDMRDAMRTQCGYLGALFDERTFDCVYTVEFWAGTDNNFPTASKKAYAGSSFSCDQNWFGIDVTTFKENAYRFTRSETSATSALMGAGVGVGVGAITSGAINRAIDTKKAKNALDKAEKAKENAEELENEASEGEDGKKGKLAQRIEERREERAERREERKEARAERKNSTGGGG